MSTRLKRRWLPGLRQQGTVPSSAKRRRVVAESPAMAQAWLRLSHSVGASAVSSSSGFAGIDCYRNHSYDKCQL